MKRFSLSNSHISPRSYTNYYGSEQPLFCKRALTMQLSETVKANLPISSMRCMLWNYKNLLSTMLSTESVIRLTWRRRMSVFFSVCLGLIVLHQKAAIRQCDIHRMYHIHAEYCSLCSHAWLMMFDYQGFAALHAKVHTQTMDAVWW